MCPGKKHGIWMLALAIAAVSPGFAPVFAPALPAFEPASKAIPEQGLKATALDYHQVPVDRASALWAEGLVEVSSYGVRGSSYYAGGAGGNPPYNRRLAGTSPCLRVRKSVAERLAVANRLLAPAGVEVYVLDGFRTVECQRDLWRFFMGEAGRLFPGASEKRRVEFAGRFCSNPHGFDERDARTWPVHATGGAVDVTLADRKTGKLLDMGGAFDEASPRSRTAFYEQAGDGAASDARTLWRGNRRLLYWAMIRAGFSNYPHEWWHYDYGDQMYVMMGGKVTSARGAVYGPAR